MPESAPRIQIDEYFNISLTSVNQEEVNQWMKKERVLVMENGDEESRKHFPVLPERGVLLFDFGSMKLSLVNGEEARKLKQAPVIGDGEKRKEKEKEKEKERKLREKLRSKMREEGRK
jgi:hypothetical protein